MKTPLEIVDNPDPHVKLKVIGELTAFEESMYDEVLLSGLGKGTGKGGSVKPTSSATQAISDENVITPLDLSVPTDDVECETIKPGLPLDLSVDSVQMEHMETISTPKAEKTDKVNQEEAALFDKPLQPDKPPLSPPRKPMSHVTSPIKLNSEVRIQLNKLILRPDQCVIITSDILNKLPTSK